MGWDVDDDEGALNRALEWTYVNKGALPHQSLFFSHGVEQQL